MVLAVIGNIIINIGMNSMKHAHNINSDPETGKPMQHFARIPWWWVGMLGIVGGEVGNLIAYGYAPASIVTPIGSIGVVTNVILTTFVLKERLTLRILVGVGLVIAGIAMTVIFAPLSMIFVGSSNLWTDVLFRPNFAIYLAWMAVMLLILYPLSRKYGEKTVVIYVAMCAVFGSFSIVCAKTFSTMIKNAIEFGVETELLSPWPYGVLVMMVVTCFLAMRYVNTAMMAFGNSQVVPVYFALFTVAGVGAAAFVYHEFQCMETTGKAVAFFLGILVAIVGVFMVSTGGGNSTQVVPEDATSQAKVELCDVEKGELEKGEYEATMRDLSYKGSNCSNESDGRPGPSTSGDGDLYPATPLGPDIETLRDLRISANSPSALSINLSSTISGVVTYSASSAAKSTVAKSLTATLSPQRQKREKQMKDGRCGLNQLRPLPPLARPPASGGALPLIVSSPSPLPP